MPHQFLLVGAPRHPMRHLDHRAAATAADVVERGRANRHAWRVGPDWQIAHHFTCISLSQPSWPRVRKVSMFFSKMSEASGKASTARSTLSSRSRCKVGYGERLV